MITNNNSPRKLLKYWPILPVLLFIFLTVSISIRYGTPDNHHWLIIGSAKCITTLSLVLIAIINFRESTISGKAPTFLVIALCFEALCDLFIEYGFEIGGMLSLTGLFFYSMAFISASSEKPTLVKTVLWAILFTTLFFVFQISAIGFMKKTFQLTADAPFLVYMLFLSMAVSISFSVQIPIGLKIAITVFYASDYIVYLQVLAGLLPEFRILNAILYYGAQILFVGSAFLVKGRTDILEKPGLYRES